PGSGRPDAPTPPREGGGRSRPPPGKGGKAPGGLVGWGKMSRCWEPSGDQRGGAAGFHLVVGEVWGEVHRPPGQALLAPGHHLPSPLRGGGGVKLPHRASCLER